MVAEARARAALAMEVVQRVMVEAAVVEAEGILGEVVVVVKAQGTVRFVVERARAPMVAVG